MRDNLTRLSYWFPIIEAAGMAIEKLAKDVSRAVPGFWSVDCLLTSDRGWVVTDMAEGEKSYRYEQPAST